MNEGGSIVRRIGIAVMIVGLFLIGAGLGTGAIGRIGAGHTYTFTVTSPDKGRVVTVRAPRTTPTGTTTAPVTTTVATTTVGTTTAVTTTVGTTTVATTGTIPASGYPLHTNIVATTFWVGEIFDASIADGSQVCSTYDSEWASHWSGGQNLGGATEQGCTGAPVGGCDGVATGTTVGTFKCKTEARDASNNYFPHTNSGYVGASPAENPFYLDLPFDDINDSTAFKERCSVIPWAAGSPDCSNQNVSFMKNRWVAITGPNGHTCYGQVEDAGPSHGSLYHDAAYVFGSSNVQPVQGQFNDAGMDVSPALNGCLGFAELDGDSDHVNWQFVDAPPAGPWTLVVTTSGVS